MASLDDSISGYIRCQVGHVCWQWPGGNSVSGCLGPLWEKSRTALCVTMYVLSLVGGTLFSCRARCSVSVANDLAVRALQSHGLRQSQSTAIKTHKVASSVPCPIREMIPYNAVQPDKKAASNRLMWVGGVVGLGRTTQQKSRF